MISRAAQLVAVSFLAISGVVTIADCLRLREIDDVGKYRWWSPNGKEARWKELPVSWSYSCSNDGGQPEFREAALWWNERMAAEVFAEFPCGTGDVMITGVEDLPMDTALAATYIGASPDGEFIMTVTRVSSYYGFATPECKQTAARHELGHALGLGHSPRYECLMFEASDLDAGEPKDLCPDEEAMFRRVYGLEQDAGSM